MRILLGSDHAGYDLKNHIKEYLVKKGYQVDDYGTNDNTTSVDYPDYADKVGHSVVENKENVGILFCGTGIGISIAANKIKGVRAALVYDELTAKLAKEHNHANVIALGGRTTSFVQGEKIVDSYLNAHEESRHIKRIDKITKIEEE